MNDQDEIVIEFAKPIKLGKGEDAVTYDKVTLREPLAGELEKASRADTSVGSIINMISLISNVPRGVAERMTQRDLKKADQFFQGFSALGAMAEADGQS